jgi:heat-inducible transcriptional repressor
MAQASLNPRSLRVLATLVREHIDTGEPVASLMLVRRGGFRVSSATIRSILAKLEDQGYVRQPHTSAGRIPTDRGYRSYVDHLLDTRKPGRPAAGVEALLRQQAGDLPLVETLLAAAPHVLSRASHGIGFATALQNAAASLRHIDFVALGTTKILVVVVAEGGQVSHKVIDIGERFSADALRQAATYLNTEFTGLPLTDIRDQILARLYHERTVYDELLSRALRLAQSTFDRLPEQQSLFIEGTSTLVEEASEPRSQISMATLGTLLRMIEEKHRLVRLLSEYIDGSGVTVVIGTEHTIPDLQEFSLVASTYSDGDRTGTVGVIGPTRMRYARTISVVDNVARAVSRVLQGSGWTS